MKKLEKMSLANVKGKLSREEMKNIMAGSGQKAGFWDELVKTVAIDIIYNYGIKPLSRAVANDWNSRPGTTGSQTERYARMGPY